MESPFSASARSMACAAVFPIGPMVMTAISFPSWADNNTMSDLKDGEQKIDRYYYEDGKLIRWIDDKNRCHDNETDSEEYVTRGEKYWDYADEYKTQLNLSDDSTSAS